MQNIPALHENDFKITYILKWSSHLNILVHTSYIIVTVNW